MYHDSPNKMGEKDEFLTESALVEKLGGICLNDAITLRDAARMMPPPKIFINEAEFDAAFRALVTKMSKIFSGDPLSFTVSNPDSADFNWTDVDLFDFLEPTISVGLEPYRKHFPNNPRSAKALIMLMSRKLSVASIDEGALEMTRESLTIQVKRLASRKLDLMRFIATRYKSGYHEDAAYALKLANQLAVDFQQKIASE